MGLNPLQRGAHAPATGGSAANTTAREKNTRGHAAATDTFERASATRTSDTWSVTESTSTTSEDTDEARRAKPKSKLARYGLTTGRLIFVGALVAVGASAAIWAPVAWHALAASSAGGPIVLAVAGATLGAGILATALYLGIKHYRAKKRLKGDLSETAQAADAARQEATRAQEEATEALQAREQTKKVALALEHAANERRRRADLELKVAKELLAAHNLVPAFDAQVAQEAQHLQSEA
jgi:hypothetical protein